MVDAYVMDVLAIVLMAVIPIVITQLVLFIVALVSIMRKAAAPVADKVLWLLLVIFVGIIGPIVYFAIGSKQLDEKSQHNGR